MSQCWDRKVKRAMTHFLSSVPSPSHCCLCFLFKAALSFRYTALYSFLFFLPKESTFATENNREEKQTFLIVGILFSGNSMRLNTRCILSLKKERKIAEAFRNSRETLLAAAKVHYPRHVVTVHVSKNPSLWSMIGGKTMHRVICTANICIKNIHTAAL